MSACTPATITQQIVRTSDIPIRVEAGVDGGIGSESLGGGFRKLKSEVSLLYKENRVCSI